MTGKELIALMENPALMDKDTLPQITRLLDEYPYFQTGWMLYVKALSNIKDSSFGAELKKLAFYTGDRTQMFYLLAGERFAHLRSVMKEEELSIGESFQLIDSFLRSAGDENPGDYLSEIPEYSAYKLSNEKEETDTPDLKHHDIINQFLEADQHSPVKITLEESKNSSVPEEHSDADIFPETQFFSETLAKIYIKQQKYDKALEIIRKLSLLYPKKSVYFADQIRFLEKLIINIKK